MLLLALDRGYGALEDDQPLVLTQIEMQLVVVASLEDALDGATVDHADRDWSFQRSGENWGCPPIPSFA